MDDSQERKEWEGAFVPCVVGAGEGASPGLEILQAFRSEEEQQEYFRRMDTEPHPWGNIFNDVALSQMTESADRSVVLHGDYRRENSNWSIVDRLSRAVPPSTQERWQWDSLQPVDGLMTQLPAAHVDIYGVAFSETEFEAWLDISSKEAVINAFANADNEQSALLGAWKRNE